MFVDIKLEFFKLKRTLVWLLVLVSPVLTAIMAGLLRLRQASAEWMEPLANAAGLWALFMLPMTITALTALLAQIEHQNGMWAVLFAGQGGRQSLFFAKAVVAVSVTAMMSLLLVCLTILIVWTVRLAQSQSGFDWAVAGQFAAIVAAMWASACLMTILQLWVALRFAGFLAPISVGLAGTFLCLATMGASQALALPWVMPLAVMIDDGRWMQLVLVLGGVGGCLAALAMSWHLGRREF